jgi:hypothetical protein
VDEHDAQGLHIHTALVETTFFGIGVLDKIDGRS